MVRSYFLNHYDQSDNIEIALLDNSWEYIHNYRQNKMDEEVPIAQEHYASHKETCVSLLPPSLDQCCVLGYLQYAQKYFKGLFLMLLSTASEVGVVREMCPFQSVQ